MRNLIWIATVAVIAACSSTTSNTNNNVEVQVDEEAFKALTLEEGTRRMTVSVGGGFEMRFTLSVPALPRDTLLPFVVALHYAGNVTPFFAEDYLVNLVQPGLEAIAPIIFAPDVPGNTWNDPLSESLVMEFVTLAEQHWPIDKARIVVTGYSMGGIGAWYLVGQYPDRFSAGIPMGASPPRVAPGDVPIYVIHGAQDELFDAQLNALFVADLQQQGRNARIVVADSLSHFQAFAYVDYLKDAVPWLLQDVWP